MNKVILLLILFAQVSFARSGDQGHGGDGWLDQLGNPWLYDLKEGNLHESPYLDYQQVISDEALEKLQEDINFLDIKTAVLLAKKIAEIKEFYPALGSAIEIGIQKHEWLLSEPLIDIKDEDPFVKIQTKNKVQLAVRINTSIFIDGFYWEKLNTENRVALIFHEMIFAWMSPVAFQENNNVFYKQESLKVREIVRTLFSKRYLKYSLNEFIIYLFDLNLSPLSALNKIENIPNLVRIKIKINGLNYQDGFAYKSSYGLVKYAQIPQDKSFDITTNDLIIELCSETGKRQSPFLALKESYQIYFDIIKTDISISFDKYNTQNHGQSYSLSAKYIESVISNFSPSRTYDFNDYQFNDQCLSQVKDLFIKRFLKR